MARRERLVVRELRLDHACFYSFLLLRHGFPWLLDILGIVNFGESPDPFGVAFQWVKAVMYLKQRLSLHNVSTLLFVLHYY